MRCRWALAALLLLTACSDSGGNNTPTVPVLAWGGFRHDQLNTATGNGISGNKAAVSLLYPTNGDTTISTPAIDNKSQIYLGLRNGAVSLDDQGGVRWFADSCRLPSGLVIPFGPINHRRP
jgi:hypothetical protein